MKTRRMIVAAQVGMRMRASPAQYVATTTAARSTNILSCQAALPVANNRGPHRSKCVFYYNSCTLAAYPPGAVQYPS